MTRFEVVLFLLITGAVACLMVLLFLMASQVRAFP